jgi:hypothetical protein
VIAITIANSVPTDAEQRFLGTDISHFLTTPTGEVEAGIGTSSCL